MREITHIIDAYKQAEKANVRSVLATVVHVEGSSYRRPSARMLVDEHGITTGAISGGCLEGDALRKALFALHQDKNSLVTYDTNDEEDAVVGAQLGCNGVIQVLFEPVDVTKPHNPVMLLSQAIEHRKPSILVTVFDLRNRSTNQPGTSVLIEDNQIVAGSIADVKIQNQVLFDAKQVLDKESSLFREYIQESHTQNVFIEYFAPPITLAIVGAGNDTQVLAKMADVLGWNIFVVDGRPTHATQERFMPSCQVIVSKPEEVLESIPLDPKTVFVLMTHNYNYDLAVLKLLLEQPVAYIGILGPKKKFQRMLDDLKEEEGISLTDEQLHKIYAPIGLEIGAEKPEEIGLSVLAEIQAVLTGTKGTFLREKQTPIHSKDNTQFDSIHL